MQVHIRTTKHALKHQDTNTNMRTRSLAHIHRVTTQRLTVRHLPLSNTMKKPKKMSPERLSRSGVSYFLGLGGISKGKQREQNPCGGCCFETGSSNFSVRFGSWQPDPLSLRAAQQHLHLLRVRGQETRRVRARVLRSQVSAPAHALDINPGAQSGDSSKDHDLFRSIGAFLRIPLIGGLDERCHAITHSCREH